ncbi:MAG: CehA/McbA family metallohydrolase, partial [Halanaerobiales bacterium]
MLKYGRINYKPKNIGVDTFTTWKLIYEVGDKAINEGGKIRIGIKGRFCFAPLQASDSKAKNYISVRCGTNEDSVLKVPDEAIRNGSQYWEITVNVRESKLVAGDVVEVIFGDKKGGGPGFETRKHAQDFRINVMVDFMGTNDYQQIPDVDNYSCVPEEIGDIEMIAPSQIYSGKRFKCLLRYIDKFGNVVKNKGERADDVADFVKLRLENIKTKETKALDFKVNETAAETYEILVNINDALNLSNNELYKIQVVDNEKNLENTSNPLLFVDEEGEKNKYWGEIHGHTLLSDGQLLPEEYYRYARDREGLDFSAISDHDTHMMRREVGGEDRYLKSPFWQEPLAPWHIIKYETKKFHQPGEFVTLLGYEWTSGHCFTPKDFCLGHRNVYYLDDDERVYSHIDTESDTPLKLFDRLQGKEAFVIPHHSSRPVGFGEGDDVNNVVSGVDWKYHDPRWERLVEIYSKWGNSETDNGPRPVIDSEAEGTVQSALARGCRVGFTAGSDTHVSWPGSKIIEEGGLLPYRSGLTCVKGDNLTRGEIFNSLYERSCYATTGERIFIEFKVNGREMGKEINLTDENITAHIKARVAFTFPEGKVEVIRNNKVVSSYKGQDTIEIDWQDPIPVAQNLLTPDFI